MGKIKRIWVRCKLCDMQYELIFDEEFQNQFKKKAEYSPYPVIFPHEDHWLIIYLDHELQERGVVASNMEFNGKFSINQHKIILKRPKENG